MRKIFALFSAFLFSGLSCAFGDVNSLITDAINGDDKAQFELAKYYEQKKYDALMIHWYEKAAKHGNVNANEFLVNKYFNRGDVDKAFKLAKKLAEKGNKIGKSVLSYYYCWGAFEVPVDKHLALKYANESSDVPLSKAVLANYYANGFWGINKDVTKALSLAEESFDEGCAEGGCIHNRICGLENLRQTNSKYNEINIKLKDSDYVDAIINTYLFIPSLDNNVNEAFIKLEPFMNNKSASLYYTLSVLEQKRGNNKKSNDYYFKAAEFWDSDIIFDLYRADFNKRNVTENDILEAKKLAELGLKTKEPKFLAKLYFLFNEIDTYVKVSEKALPDNIDWNKLIKEGADNGHPVLMALHAYNIGKENSEYEKYINQSIKMGASRVVDTCLNSCKDYKKWLEIGVELKDLKSISLMGSAKLEGFIYDRKGKRLNIEKDEAKGIEFLEYALKHGDSRAASSLFDYFSKDEKPSVFSNKITLTDKQSKSFKKLLDTDDNGKNLKIKHNGIVVEEKSDKESNKIPIWANNRTNDSDIKEKVESDKVDIETYKKAYIYGCIAGIKTSRNPNSKRIFDIIESKFNSEELKELNKKVEELNNQISITKKEDKEKQRALEANYMPLLEMKFDPFK